MLMASAPWTAIRRERRHACLPGIPITVLSGAATFVRSRFYINGEFAVPRDSAGL